MNKLNDVSLVIATYNEEKSIEFVLKEIENYDFHENTDFDEIYQKYLVKSIA